MCGVQQKAALCFIVGSIFLHTGVTLGRWAANEANTTAALQEEAVKSEDSSYWKARPRLMLGAIYLPKFDYPYSTWYALPSINLRTSRVTTGEQDRGIHCSLSMEVGLLHLAAVYAKFGPEWRIGPTFYFSVYLGGMTAVSIIEENHFTLPLAGAAVGHGIRLSKIVRLEVEAGTLFFQPFVLAGVSFP